MASYVYLIQNGDLFNIGIITILNEQELLKTWGTGPFLITDTPEPLIRNLENIY